MLIVGNNHHLYLFFSTKDGYINTGKNVFSVRFFQMASLLYPICLEEYCSYFNVAFDTLTLPCIFCRGTVWATELEVFQRRRLSLVWRGNNCYAACLRCINRTAAYERFKYFQWSVKAEYIEYFSQTPLDSLIVRCLFCMALLTNEEKVDIIASGSTFQLVRGHWKGVCRECF